MDCTQAIPTHSWMRKRWMVGAWCVSATHGADLRTKIPSRVAHRWTRWPNQTSRNSDKGWTHLNYSSYGIAFTRTTLSYLAGKGIAKASWTRRTFRM
eukprot:g32076.t1